MKRDSGAPISPAACSRRHQYGVEPIFGNWDAVLLEGGGVNFDRFLDVLDGLFFAPALADAAGKAGTLCHPESVLAWVYYDLPQVSAQLLPGIISASAH